MNVQGVRVWAARFAAPVAFFLAAIVLVLIVQSAIGSDNTETDGATNQAIAPAPPAQTVAKPAAAGQQGPKRRRFYRVRAGDTLETIAARFDTDVERLIVLNPGIDPLQLTVRQRIRLR